MNKYLIRSRIHPNAYHGSLLADPSGIDEKIAEANETITVLEWFGHVEGGEQVALRLPSEGRDQAFNEALSLVQRFGYSLVDVEVAEIVDRTVEGVVLGLLTGGGVGATTKDPRISAIAAVAGALAGGKAGSMIEAFGDRHRFQWFPARGWIVTAQPNGAQSSPATPAQILFPA